MTGTLTQWLNNNVNDARSREGLRTVLTPQIDMASSQSLSSAGMVIKGASSPTVKTGSAAWYGIAQGILQKIAAGTDLAALSGTVVNATFNVFCFYVDSAGVVTSAMGTAGATLGAVVFPARPQGKAWLGFVIINPTGTGNFVGGTTNLDDATVVPNAAYVNLTGDCDPTILV